MAALRGKQRQARTRELERIVAGDALLLFERCQTTPGKPFSGTSGSPV